MTVSYQSDVASSASGGFLRLLFRWRGSVWKSIYRELIVFAVSYTALSLLYRFFLREDHQRVFERIVYYCAKFVELIPLSFMLGFYVTFTATRWWSQYTAIPWPDRMMNIIALYLPGTDDTSRMMRRTLMRYVNLSLVLVLRSISMAVKKRFPTKEHLVEAGFMTKVEMEMYSSVPSNEFNTFWIPCTWFIALLRDARQECRITDSNGIKLIMEELNDFRTKCGLLWGYDWISIPLVYTQVVTVATYAFFTASLIGRQYINSPDPIIHEKHKFDYYVPVFTVLQFIFYMGLLKVAEQLINPFGDDDEDFELNWIIDRHIKVSYLGVDTINSEPPPLVKDHYFDELDIKLPYTEAALEFKRKTYRGSVATMQVPMEQQHLVMPQTIAEEDEDDEHKTTNGGLAQRHNSLWSILGRRSVSNLDQLDHAPGSWGFSRVEEGMGSSGSSHEETEAVMQREPMYIGIIPEPLLKRTPQPNRPAICELLGQVTPDPLGQHKPRKKRRRKDLAAAARLLAGPPPDHRARAGGALARSHSMLGPASRKRKRCSLDEEAVAKSISVPDLAPLSPSDSRSVGARTLSSLNLGPGPTLTAPSTPTMLRREFPQLWRHPSSTTAAASPDHIPKLSPPEVAIKIDPPTPSPQKRKKPPAVAPPPRERRSGPPSRSSSIPEKDGPPPPSDPPDSQASTK